MRVRGRYNGDITNLRISVAKLMLSFISIRHDSSISSYYYIGNC